MRLTSAAALSASLALVSGCERGSSPQRPSTTPISQRMVLGQQQHPAGVFQISLDRSDMSVADRLTVRVLVAAPAGTSAAITPELPEPPSGKLGDFQVVAKTVSPTADENGLPASQTLVVLEPFLDGEKSIPSLKAVFQPPGAAALIEGASEPIKIQVHSVLSEEERAAPDAADLGEAPSSMRLIAPPASDRNWLIPAIAGGALAFGVAGWLVLRLTRRPSVRTPDPVTSARTRLARVESTIQAASADSFGEARAALPAAALELGSAAREFLERGLGIPAIGASTPELVARLESAPDALPHPEFAWQLAEAFRVLDAECFAPHQPRASVLAEQLAVVVKLVDHSAPAVQAGARRRAA